MDLSKYSDQFKILIAEKEKLVATWTVPPDLPFLEGHFPGQPLVPGVVLINLSAYIIIKYFKLQILNGISNSKFIYPVRPESTVTLGVTAKENHRFHVTWTVGDREASEMTLDFS